MKILQSWIEDYIKINLTTKELVEKLVSSGTEVEDLTGNIDDEIVIARIDKIAPHPNADRLRVVEVYDGKEALQIVCGASNIEVGQHVPLARKGASINGQMITETDLRGVMSHGMLCSEKELGLGDDHSGIKIISEAHLPGTKLNQIHTGDLVFDLEITPNRGDCLSHIGLAREIAAIENCETKRLPIQLKLDSLNASKLLKVTIEDKKGCTLYMARILKGVRVGPSPEWLKNRLEKVGLKSINNIVDITNYIMLDLGQPLHAFDYAKIDGGEVVVRKAKNGEQLESLDEKLIDLDKSMLVIADTKKPIALAGIIGGSNSGITEETRDIVIEAATFNSSDIRKTGRKLKLSTNASYRFERSVDDGSVQYAIDKAAKLIKEVAEGSILSGIVQDGKVEEPLKLVIPYHRINNLLGTNLTDTEINKFLKLYGFKIEGSTAIVPSYRHDVFFWQDLAEEVARGYGYDKIEDIKLEKNVPKHRSGYYFKEVIKDRLVKLGLTEVISYPFTSDCGPSKESDLLEVANPVQPENKYLRASLLYGLYKVVAKNSAFDPVTLFEIGQVFSKKNESTHLAVVLAGAEKALLGLIKEVEAVLGVILGKFVPASFKEITADELKGIKTRKSKIYALEIDLGEMANKKLDYDFKTLPKDIHYRRVSKFPSITRDLAFLVESQTDNNLVIDSIYQISEVVNQVELFDEYVSERLGKNLKSIAFHIALQDLTRTLTDSEADRIVGQIIETLAKRFKAKLRS